MPDFTPLRLRSGAGGDYANGLCVMEAVSWIAGGDATDKPECACPVLGAFAIDINDRLDDEARQLLLPLVVPLAGTRSPEHASARAEYIVLRVIREILPMAFDAIGLDEHARAVRDSEDLVTAADAVWAAARAARAADPAVYAAIKFASDAIANAAARASAAYAARVAARSAAYAAVDVSCAAERAVLTRCIDILSGAIDLGPNGRDHAVEYEPHVEALAEFARTVLEKA